MRGISAGRHNTTENGRWDPMDHWATEAHATSDMLTMLSAITGLRFYLDGIGYADEVQVIWRLWREAHANPG